MTRGVGTTHRIERFGHYLLLHRFAVGGTAELFLAKPSTMPDSDRLVVVKRLRRELCDSRQFIDMFIDEERVLSELNHPNIVHTLEFGRINGLYFIALEHIWGESVATLSALCTQQGLHFPVAAALYIGCETAKALAHAHMHMSRTGTPTPVIHRDVTLGNVVISYDGDVKVLDFGIAKADNRLGETLAGQIKGTLAYLSPEQILRVAQGPATDIYQLGVFLYKLLVGREPVSGDSEYQIMQAIVSSRIQRPSQVVPGFPPRIERMLLKALARDPSNRYATAGEFVAELIGLLGSAYSEGQAGLGRMVARLTDDRRIRQSLFINDLLHGLNNEPIHVDSAECLQGQEEPTAINVELSASVDEDGIAQLRNDLTDLIAVPSGIDEDEDTSVSAVFAAIDNIKKHEHAVSTQSHDQKAHDQKAHDQKALASQALLPVDILTSTYADTAERALLPPPLEATVPRDNADEHADVWCQIGEHRNTEVDTPFDDDFDIDEQDPDTAEASLPILAGSTQTMRPPPLPLVLVDDEGKQNTDAIDVTNMASAAVAPATSQAPNASAYSLPVESDITGRGQVFPFFVDLIHDEVSDNFEV